MGLCFSDAATKAIMDKSHKVDHDMDMRKREAERRIKLLLLGSGESGKSTIFKQMRILHGKGFSQDEREKMVEVIQQSIMAQMQVLVDMAEELDCSIADTKSAAAFGELDPSSYDSEAAEIVSSLWGDTGIQRAYELRSRFQLNDSAAYFFEKAQAIAAPDYIASTDDILHLRVKTMGIVEEEFVMGGTKFVMYDVGGQRNERKKWIHCFEDVTAVLFVAAISEYDQVLYEDVSQNRLEEALNLFDEIANSRWFDNTAMILFLNKRDKFEDKIRSVDIRQERPDGTVQFEDYTGGCSYANGLKYIIRLFISRNRNEDRELYYHVTTATNTENIDTVFKACKHIILKDNLAATGFLD